MVENFRDHAKFALEVDPGKRNAIASSRSVATVFKRRPKLQSLDFFSAV